MMIIHYPPRYKKRMSRATSKRKKWDIFEDGFVDYTTISPGPGAYNVNYHQFKHNDAPKWTFRPKYGKDKYATDGNVGPSTYNPNHTSGKK